MSRTWLTTTGVIVAIVLLIAVNFLGNTLLHSSRVDLTENNLYTLSDGTRNILKSLDEPITLRLFISQKMITRLPSISSFANRVKSLLREYERDSGGKITLRVIDPEPFSEEEDRAVGYGLQGIPFDDAEGTLYFGVVGTNSTDLEDALPFISQEREEFLEYDVTQLIYRLTKPTLPAVGIISKLPLEGGPLPQMPGVPPQQGGIQPPWMIYEQASEFFDFRNITETIHEIPNQENMGALLLIHPKDISEEELYYIDQYVLGGGRLIAFIDPQAEADIFRPGTQVLGAKRDSNIDRLSKGWGVELVAQKYAGDLSRALKVRSSPQHGNEIIEFPLWMQLSDAELDQDDLVTSKLGAVTLASSGYFKIDPAVGTTIVPLVTTSDRAMIMESDTVGPGKDPRDILKDYVPGGVKLPLAVRISGAVKSAFPDGPPKGVKNENHLAESADAINVLMVADTDILQDRYWVQIQNMMGSRMAVPVSGNSTFFNNAIDNMLGSSDLISVRNRGSYTRPFTLVQDIRQDAEMKYREKEQELIAQLDQTENQLQELDKAKEDDSVIMSAEQQSLIQQFRDDKVRIRKDLRSVRRELNQDIESVESLTKFVNIGVVPIFVALAGVLIGLIGVRRRRRIADAAADRAVGAVGS